MKRELTDVKPGVEFLATLQKIESNVDHYNSELEEMSSFLKESENSDLVGLEFITPNSEQSYKGKVKTHNYINRQNQSTTGKL
jgi:hypothetical protein